jgi:hypothetical protein
LSERITDVQVGESISEQFDQEVGCVQGSLSGHLLFCLLVTISMKADNLVKIAGCADESCLVFEEDFWDEVFKIASTETTCVIDWLLDVGMVVNSLKTKAIYFSKHGQVRL